MSLPLELRLELYPYICSAVHTPQCERFTPCTCLNRIATLNKQFSTELLPFLTRCQTFYFPNPLDGNFYLGRLSPENIKNVHHVSIRYSTPRYPHRTSGPEYLNKGCLHLLERLAAVNELEDLQLDIASRAFYAKVDFCSSLARILPRLTALRFVGLVQWSGDRDTQVLATIRDALQKTAVSEGKELKIYTQATGQWWSRNRVRMYIQKPKTQLQ